jgi:hypothetical protein
MNIKKWVSKIETIDTTEYFKKCLILTNNQSVIAAPVFSIKSMD